MNTRQWAVKSVRKGKGYAMCECQHHSEDYGCCCGGYGGHHHRGGHSSSRHGGHACCGHDSCCCGAGENPHAFHRRFHNREERAAELEAYLKELEAEIQGVREALAERHGG